MEIKPIGRLVVGEIDLNNISSLLAELRQVDQFNLTIEDVSRLLHVVNRIMYDLTDAALIVGQRYIAASDRYTKALAEARAIALFEGGEAPTLKDIRKAITKRIPGKETFESVAITIDSVGVLYREKEMFRRLRDMINTLSKQARDILYALRGRVLAISVHTKYTTGDREPTPVDEESYEEMGFAL